jgi:hypothetical protein
MATRREKLETMPEVSPSDQMLRYMLALELEKEGAHDRSLELFQQLMNDGVPYVPAFLMAGQQLAKLARIDEAKAAYRTGIEAATVQGNSHAAGEMAGFLAAMEEL